MKRLSQEDLLEGIEKLVAPARARQAMYYGSRNEQVHKQIKELIQKPQVTEEWIEEKAEELADISYYHQVEGKQAKDFIRSLVEGVHVS